MDECVSSGVGFSSEILTGQDLEYRVLYDEPTTGTPRLRKREDTSPLPAQGTEGSHVTSGRLIPPVTRTTEGTNSPDSCTPLLTETGVETGP